MKILIVDDSKAMQVILRRGIEKFARDDIEIKVAENGHKALEIIRVWRPSLVLSDWHMPEMTGIELLNAINSEMLDIHVGFVTTETSLTRVKEAKDAGAKFILNKPFNDETLHKTVSPYLSNSADIQTLDTDERPNPNDSIMLPSTAMISKLLNVVSKSNVVVETVPPMSCQSAWSPCLLGLFADSRENKVRAVSILNLPAACILGASIEALPENIVQSSIQEKSLPKPILNNCEKLLKVFCAVLKDQNEEGETLLRSVNFVPQVFPKIETLLQKPESERVDFSITIPGYGQGNLTIIRS